MLRVSSVQLLFSADRSSFHIYCLALWFNQLLYVLRCKLLPGFLHKRGKSSYKALRNTIWREFETQRFSGYSFKEIGDIQLLMCPSVI